MEAGSVPLQIPGLPHGRRSQGQMAQPHEVGVEFTWRGTWLQESLLLIMLCQLSITRSILIASAARGVVGIVLCAQHAVLTGVYVAV